MNDNSAINLIHAYLVDLTENPNVYRDKRLNEKLVNMLSVIKLLKDSGNNPSDFEVFGFITAEFELR